MKKMTQKECKQVMLSILEYIDKLCRDNNIKYSLFCGSLIGAVRHKGIIPWDDDIDIILLKDDYDKLIKVLKKQKSKYLLLDHETNSDYYNPFPKLVDTDTKIIQDNLNIIDNYGIFVDIFCYNNIPNDKKIFYYKKVVFYKILISWFMEKNTVNNHKFSILKKVSKIITEKIIGKEIILNRYIKLCNKYNNIDCDFVMSNWPEYYNPLSKEIAYKKEYTEYIDTEFENITVMITKNYDEVLTRYFGDYMTPPPEDKRISHGFTAYWRYK